jgi:hypothetical protein
VKNSLIYSGIKPEKEEFDLILNKILEDFLKFFEDLAELIKVIQLQYIIIFLILLL